MRFPLCSRKLLSAADFDISNSLTYKWRNNDSNGVHIEVSQLTINSMSSFFTTTFASSFSLQHKNNLLFRRFESQTITFLLFLLSFSSYQFQY